MTIFWILVLWSLLEMMAGALQRDPLTFANGVSNYSRLFGQLVHEGLRTSPKKLPISTQALIVRATRLTFVVICLCEYSGVWLR
jgi:hypothetical protein